MKCTKCGVELPTDAKFCGKCGTPVMVSAKESQSVQETVKNVDAKQVTPRNLKPNIKSKSTNLQSCG